MVQPAAMPRVVSPAVGLTVHVDSQCAVCTNAFSSLTGDGEGVSTKGAASQRLGKGRAP